LNIAGEDGHASLTAAIRSGVQVIQVAPRMAPLLTALEDGLREEPGSFYPEAEEDLSQLLKNGLVLDLQDAEQLDESKYRLIPRGSGGGFDDESLDFRIQGTTSVLVPELAYWAWVYGSTCSSVRQVAELVAALHPNATADAVVRELRRTLVSLHRSGCMKLDAALTSE
jgi:hypothetical protein